MDELAKAPHFDAHTAFRFAPRDAADLPALVDLWVASWQAVMPQIDFDARRDWLEAHIAAKEREGATTLCAFDAGDCLAGFLLLETARDYLDQIAVHPRHFGGGLAVQLLDIAKARCPDGLMLDVNSDNQRALRFYARHGFACVAAGTNPNSGLPTFTLRFRPARG